MLVGMVSTIALILAFGPQLQVAPGEADPSAPIEELVEEAVNTSELEIEAPEETPETVEDESELKPPVTEPEDTNSEPNASDPLDDANATDPAPLVLEPMESVETETLETAPDAEIEGVVLEPSVPETEIARRGEIPEAEWPSLLSAASNALAEAKTAKGKFIQTNGDGSVVTGTFALNRPGRTRFDYDDPTPVLIVSDGTTVAMEDRELETVDRVPLGATPLGLILSTELDVDTDIEVLSVLENEERIGIRVQDATGELEGTLTMVFDKVSYQLLGWLSVDGNLQTTVVDLLDVETNVRIDPRLFRLDEDEDEEDER